MINNIEKIGLMIVLLSFISLAILVNFENILLFSIFPLILGVLIIAYSNKIKDTYKKMKKIKINSYCKDYIVPFAMGVGIIILIIIFMFISDPRSCKMPTNKQDSHKIK